MAFLFEFVPQFGKIIDFSVENNHHRAIFIEHRLAAVFAQVDNREPAVAQGDLIGTVEAILIRASVRQSFSHRANEVFVPPVKSAYSTHNDVSSLQIKKPALADRFLSQSW
jgi:hypothetical protein